MKGRTIVSVTLGSVALATSLFVVTVEGQSKAKDQKIESFIPKDHRFESFVPKRGAAPEGPARLIERQGIDRAAQTGFDNLTNGFAPQGPDFDKLNEDNVVPTRSFTDGRVVCEEVERQDDGGRLLPATLVVRRMTASGRLTTRRVAGSAIKTSFPVAPVKSLSIAPVTPTTGFSMNHSVVRSSSRVQPMMTL